LAISIDDIATHETWLNASPKDGGVGKLRFPLGSDIDGKVSKAFGVWDDDLELAHRGLFFVDPQGVIQYSLVHGPSVGRNVDESLRVLDGLQSGGLCPVAWTAADGTLDVESLLKPGRMLGHYRIVEELGRGTFGSVFKADDLRLKRRVALKVLKQTDGAAATGQLLEEARSAAAIQHPNICTVYAVDEIDGLPVIAMEFLDGQPLSEAIGNVTDLPGAVEQLAQGLHAAHSANVVHGDLKPGNIIVAESRLVIVDFGLALNLQSESSSEDQEAERSEGLTQDVAISLNSLNRKNPEVNETVDCSGSSIPGSEVDHTGDWIQDSVMLSKKTPISGTPGYMAPEILKGESASKASDVFALGVICLELQSGQTKVLGSTFKEIFSTLAREDLADHLIAKFGIENPGTLKDMLQYAPGRRPMVGELIEAS